MNPSHQVRRIDLLPSTAQQREILESDVESPLLVSVIYSNRDGTLAALRKAGTLAKNLGGHIQLVVPQVVPFHFPLDRPPIPIQFLERRKLSLVTSSGIDAEEVSIQIHLCRNRRDCLKQVLEDRCLVVIGGQRRWWFGEDRSLERFVRGLGHQVIFVEREDKSRVGRFLRADLRSILRGVLGLHQNK